MFFWSWNNDVWNPYIAQKWLRSKIQACSSAENNDVVRGRWDIQISRAAFDWVAAIDSNEKEALRRGQRSTGPRLHSSFGSRSSASAKKLISAGQREPAFEIVEVWRTRGRDSCCLRESRCTARNRSYGMSGGEMRLGGCLGGRGENVNAWEIKITIRDNSK